MAKIHIADEATGWHMFHCPGCGNTHSFWTKDPSKPNWKFNHDLDKPTITPSHRVKSANDKGDTCCHSFIKYGNIQYLWDSTHHLAGKTIELPEWD